MFTCPKSEIMDVVVGLFRKPDRKSVMRCQGLVVITFVDWAYVGLVAGRGSHSRSANGRQVGGTWKRLREVLEKGEAQRACLCCSMA
jgi:hypothetical protein